MKTKLFLFLFLTVALCGANAQGTSDVYRYFADGIDEAVAASKTVVEDTDEEKTNFVYSRLFTSPVLYSSMLGKPVDEEVTTSLDETL